MNPPTFEEMLAAVRRGTSRPRPIWYARTRITSAAWSARLASQSNCRVFDSSTSASRSWRVLRPATSGQFDLHSPDDLRRLLVTMALNKVISKARREQHHAGGLPDDWDAADTLPSPSEAVAERDLAEHARSRLSEREYQLFEQNKVLRRSWSEIAVEVGGDPDGIQLTRAIARLQGTGNEEAEDVR
jgi:hypothetical protein